MLCWLKKSNFWRFRFPPPSLNYLTRDRPETLRWLDHGFILVDLRRQWFVIELAPKLIHKIPTRHCKQSHARSYDYSTTPQQNIITWLKEIIISYIFSFNDIVTIIRLDLHIYTSFVILPRIVQFTWKSVVLFQHILSKTVIAN